MIGEKLLSIKKFAKITGIKETTLRYFDEMGLFSPMKKGDQGYRYYAPTQIITINELRLFKDLSLTLKEMCQITKDKTPEKILQEFVKKEEVVRVELERIRRQHEVLATRIRLMQIGQNEKNISVREAFMDERHYALGPKNDFGLDSKFYDTFMNFCSQADRYHIDLRFPIGGLFDSLENFIAKPSQPDYYFSVDPEGPETKPAGNFLVAYVRGYYGEPGDVAERVQKYIKERHLNTEGPVYMVYVLDEIAESDPDQYLAQVTVKLKDW
ncbi:MAG: MerR family transcriptional regulator [Lachnospiraceae bacterium]|nr:MerR family transcriptional regulator [Lachnospiraceae bacterium]